MTQETWKITLLISRQKGQQKSGLQSFSLEISPDEYVLDAVERVWAFQDRSLTPPAAPAACWSMGLKN
jgi:succinate dehydrogenase/fumarate reductase-like Fe-S protein